MASPTTKGVEPPELPAHPGDSPARRDRAPRSRPLLPPSEPPLNLPLEIRRATGSTFVQDLYRLGTPARAFLPDFDDLDEYRAKRAEVDGRLTGEARRAWSEAVTAPGERAQRRLDAVLGGEGYLVTTGQQPGLLGGPLYSLYKGITAGLLADRLEESLGVPVAPLFWIASEDHDWAEADHSWLIDLDNELVRLTLPEVEGAGERPLHRLAMGEGVVGVLDRCRELVPPSDFAEAELGALAEAFTPDATLPDAFEATMARLLEPLGMLFVQAHAPALKTRSRELLLTELERSAAHEVRLKERASALSEAGYRVQVPILDEAVNLFLEGPAGRERVYCDGEAFRLRHSGERLDGDGIRARVADDPSILSPNVLLRPVVESHVFPTLAYVAGPGEIAYFAQLEPLFEAHGIGMPVVFPRMSATALEGKVVKVLEKFGLAPGTLARPFHEVAGEVARDEMPEEVRRALGELRGAIARGTQTLTEAAREVDPTLKGPIGHVRSAAFEALGEAERKIVQAVKRENEIALQQLEKAAVHLFPDGKPQERMLGPLQYLVRYPDFVQGITDAFRAGLPDFQEEE